MLACLYTFIMLDVEKPYREWAEGRWEVIIKVTLSGSDSSSLITMGLSDSAPFESLSIKRISQYCKYCSLYHNLAGKRPWVLEIQSPKSGGGCLHKIPGAYQKTNMSELAPTLMVTGDDSDILCLEVNRAWVRLCQ